MTRNFLSLFIGLVLGALITFAFIHHSPRPWEYKTVWYEEQHYKEDLYKAGMEGWEVTGIIPEPGGQQMGLLILKRQK